MTEDLAGLRSPDYALWRWLARAVSAVMDTAAIGADFAALTGWPVAREKVLIELHIELLVGQPLDVGPTRDAGTGTWLASSS